MFEAAPINQFSERAIAAQAGFSVDDYGKENGGPYQVVMPAYGAPQWLSRFAALGPALRECGTLCKLRGLPFRAVRWGREGSGMRGGIPCAACARTTPNPARFPRPLEGCQSCRGGRGGRGCRACAAGVGCASCRGAGYIPGYPDAHPIAEFRPNGQRLVFNNQGIAQLVGRPNYAVSHNPFPRLYRPEKYSQNYLDAVSTAQAYAAGSGKRAFVCTGPLASNNSKIGVPVGYVDPDVGNRIPATVTPVSQQYFQELVAESLGRSYLGQGA